MKNVLTKTYTLLGLLGAFALASCGSISIADSSSEDEEPSSSLESEDSSSESEESSSSGSSTSSNSTYEIPNDSEDSDDEELTVGIYLTVENEYISANTAFLDSASPYVEYYNGFRMSDVTSQATFELENITYGGTYSGTEPLDEGLYTVTATYTAGRNTYTSKSKYVAVEFYEAEENAGYKVIDPEFTLDKDYRLSVFGLEGTSPCVGSPKFLVVPISFSNVSDWTEDELEDLYDVYIADDFVDEGGFFSLHEYYYESSYGKLDMEIEIADPYQLPISTDTFEGYGSNSNCMSRLCDYFVEEFTEERGYDFDDYDSDGNGYIDGIHFIYKTNKTVGYGIWWNYTSYFDFNANGVTTDEGESMAAPCTYFFSAYASMDSYGYPDSHTIIHETGHMLGLDDYYSYDYNEGPAGGALMMDLNIGDQDPYSKMLLGWTNPYVIDGSSDHFTITLKPFESSGEFILLPDIDEGGYNGTPFDEYLLLSYYTPTGLNEPDSDGYEEWAGYEGYGRGGTYEHAGLQVYHVDARTGVYYVRGGYEYIDVTEATDYYMDYLSPLASNTASYSAERNNRLIEAVSADGVDRFDTSSYYSYVGEDTILFGTEDYHGGDAYTPAGFQSTMPEGLTFNSGEDIDYAFSVLSMDEESITIRFDRNGA